jgi:hypothetical protein
MVPREVVMGLDALERRISFIAAGITAIIAAYFLPHLLKNTTVTDTANKAKSKPYCSKPYHLVGNACKHLQLTHPSFWWPEFLLIIVLGSALLIFALRRKRVGVVVAGLMSWLALTSSTIPAAGLPFLFVAGWLLVRAFRLQKWGNASFSGSNQAAREQAKAKRAGREASPRVTKSARRSKPAPEPAVARSSAPPAPSKRYTPKQKPRKR